MSDFATTHLFVLFCSHSHRRRHRNELRAKMYTLLHLLIHSFSREHSLASLFVFQDLYQSNWFLSSMPKKAKTNNANFMMAMGDECQSLFSGKGEGRMRSEKRRRQCDRFLMAFRLENEGG